jgi:hypothetical protein
MVKVCHMTTNTDVPLEEQDETKMFPEVKIWTSFSIEIYDNNLKNIFIWLQIFLVSFPLLV